MKNNSQKINSETKLVVITRGDLTPGYQMVQSQHAIADLTYELTTLNPNTLQAWKNKSNSIVSLGVKDLPELYRWYHKIKDQVITIKFYEPDIGEDTAIAFIATDQIRKSLSCLPLSLKSKNKN